ncbi:MAG: hypothetical protein RL338_1940 [Chloroflexota bacterium]
MGPMTSRSDPRPTARLLAVALVATTLAGCAGPVEAESAATPSTARATPAVAGATPPIPSAAPGPTGRPATTPTPSPAPSASATPVPVATPVPEPFELDLYRRGDFVGQYTFEWCVGASVQMALNIVGPEDDRTRVRQQALWERARDLSSSPFGGANPRGWTAVLNESGTGRWELISVPDLDAALRAAAIAIRSTGRPVGLVMWRGRHAWVMSGFTSLGDPAATPGFEVTGVRVLDPLYPHGSERWGSSPRPNALLAPEELATQYVPRLRGRVDLGVPPGYLLIVPRA